MSAPAFDRLHVVLVRTRNPLNIGAAARAMNNFGFAHLRVVNPYPVAFRDARSAVGAPEVLAEAEEYKHIADAVADCTLVVGTTAGRNREMNHTLRSLRQAVPIVRRRLASGRVALLFGSEKTGLSNHDFSHCHWLMNIPTANSLSMNLGQAVAVCLYELARGPRPQKTETQVLAAARELECITQLLAEALRVSEYTQPSAAKVTEEKLRRLVRQLSIPQQAASVWLGMLRQILWKLKSS